MSDLGFDKCSAVKVLRSLGVIFCTFRSHKIGQFFLLHVALFIQLVVSCQNCQDDNPETLLQAVSCRNYFFFQPYTVLLTAGDVNISGVLRSVHGRKKIVLKWNRSQQSVDHLLKRHCCLYFSLIISERGQADISSADISKTQQLPPKPSR